MKIIKSKDNPVYKTAVRLTKKKYRDASGDYLLEGVKPIRDALENGAHIKTIFVQEDSSRRSELPQERMIILGKELFETLSDTETSQGIIAVAAKKQFDEGSFMAAVKDRNLAVLDRLQDPGNVGTIIRTAEAAGYGGIIIVRGSGDVYAPKVVRAAAGSILRTPMFFADDGDHAIRLIRKMKRKLTVTDLNAQQNCFEADLSRGIALVIGNEGRGAGKAFLDAADMKIKIPMEGSIESLNAAVAAGILMYQSQKTNWMRGKQDASAVDQNFRRC